MASPSSWPSCDIAVLWPSQFLWNHPQCDHPRYYGITINLTAPVSVATPSLWPSQFSWYPQCDRPNFCGIALNMTVPVFIISSMTVLPSQFSYCYHQWQCDRPSFHGILNDSVTVPVFMVSSMTMWPSQFSWYPQWQCDRPSFCGIAFALIVRLSSHLPAKVAPCEGKEQSAWWCGCCRHVLNTCGGGWWELSRPRAQECVWR